MTVTVIACGALASELRAVLAGVGDVDIRVLPANLHNRPDGIVPAVTIEAIPALDTGDRRNEPDHGEDGQGEGDQGVHGSLPAVRNCNRTNHK